MTTPIILTYVFSALALVFSGLAIYFNVKARRLRKEVNEEWRRHRALMALTFAERYGAVTPHKLAETFPTNPPDPAAFGDFIASLPYEETEVKMAASPPGPAAWVGGGGDFSGGGASGSFDSSPDVSGSSDSGSCDSGSSDSSSSSSGCD